MEVMGYGEINILERRFINKSKIHHEKNKCPSPFSSK